MRESNVERASRISALLLSLPADEHGARDLAACLHRADGVLHGGGAWYARLDECVIPDGARIEGPRLRVRCGVCREWMWTLLAEPQDACVRCQESPAALHPGFGTPHTAYPPSERQFNGGLPVDAGQGEDA